MSVMATVSLAQLLDAVKTTLSAATGLTTTQGYADLTESLNDFPVLQITPESGAVGATGETDRVTFGSTPVRHHVYTIHADLYAGPRAHIGDDISNLVDLIDALETVLVGQTGTLFGLSSIDYCRWSWSRATFVYNDERVYVGARFIIELGVI